MDNLRKQADMTNAKRIGRPPMDPYARFDSHVDFTGTVPPGLDTPCWLWTGASTGNGYAQFQVGGRLAKQAVGVHRFSYERWVGAIPDGYQIDHLCKVRLCVNPAHLEAVPPVVNNARSESPSAINRRRTVCKQGLHELSPENLSPCFLARGQRVCLECLRQAQRRRRARARQQNSN